MKLDDFTTLGRTGLRVSPVCLGAMTFGTEWGWGADEATARGLFDRYFELGGNFVDTADMYTNGRSEEFVGKFVKEKGLRDHAVIATKFTFNAQAKNPNAGGNGRKNILRAVEGSLKRLGTDYIDLYYLHCWDTRTPVEEVGETLTALVRSGKVRHVGLSDVPAWYAARYQTLAEARGWERIAALQLEYSLVERTIEREHVPLAKELGIAIVPWGPLASGFLSGKYQRGHEGAKGEGRIATVGVRGNPVFDRLAKPSEKMWSTLDALTAVAEEIGRTPADVALAWVVGQPNVTSTLVGATKLQQLESNVAAADLELPEAARRKLDEASALELVHPYINFIDAFQAMIDGGARVRTWRT